MPRLHAAAPFVLITALTGPVSAQERCEVERINKNGDSIGDPGCPDRGDLARLGGGKDSQLFLVRGDRPPEGEFSLESQNGGFETGQFTLEDGRLRLFLSDANGQQSHSLYNYDLDDGGTVPPDPGTPPIDPTDPTHPTDPPDPGTPPIDPTDPTDPGSPVDPTDPELPIDPTDPGLPPVDPTSLTR